MTTKAPTIASVEQRLDAIQTVLEQHGMELQAGASDQWGNITAGVELIRRRLSAQAFAVTHPLMVKSDGSKFGKSVGERCGSILSARRRTSSVSSGCRWPMLMS